MHGQEIKKKRSTVILQSAIEASKNYAGYLISILSLSLFLMAYLIVGILTYKSLEGWELRESLYFISVSLMAVGYGDLYPTSAKSRVFTMCYCLTGIGLMLVCFKRLLEIIIHRRLLKRKQLQEKLVDMASERFTIALNISKNNSKKSRFQQKLEATTRRVSLVPAYETIFHEDEGLFSTCHQMYKRWMTTHPKLTYVTITVALFVGYLCTTAAVIQVLKVPNPNEEFGGCMYFAVISGLTIGYGDIVPRKEMRWFMVFFIPLNILIFSRLLYKLDDVLRSKSSPSSLGNNNKKSGGAIESGKNVSKLVLGGVLYEDEDISLSTWPEDLLSVEALLESTEGVGENGESGEADITELDYLRFMLKGSGLVSQDTLDDLHDRFTQVYDHINNNARFSTSSNTTQVSGHSNVMEGGGEGGFGLPRSSVSGGGFGVSRASLRESLTCFDDGVDFSSIYAAASSKESQVELKEITSV